MTVDDQSSLIAVIFVTLIIILGSLIGYGLSKYSGHETFFDRCSAAGGVTIQGVSKWECINPSALIKMEK